MDRSFIQTDTTVSTVPTDIASVESSSNVSDTKDNSNQMLMQQITDLEHRNALPTLSKLPHLLGEVISQLQGVSRVMTNLMDN